MFARKNQKTKAKSNVRSSNPPGSEVTLNLESLYVPIDGDEWLSQAEKKVRRDFLAQVQEAFETEPSISGVVHGQRKIRLGKEGSRSSYFPSMKNARGGRSTVYLPMESRLEARYALELERDNNVLAFRTQSIQLKLLGTGNPIFPDFMILDKASRLLLREVKADLRFVAPAIRDRIENLRYQLARYGISYDAVDASHVPSLRKYENLKWLYQRIINYPMQEEIEAFSKCQFLRSTYGALKSISESMGLSESVIPYLLFTEQLNTDWETTLNDKSEVWK